MDNKSITFDQVFNIWMDAEANQVEGRNILPVAKEKGFGSIAEWRLATALKLGMDKKEWSLVTIENPDEVLPNIIIGPYRGWSKFFDNHLNTTFAQALEIPEFFEWCKTHDRVVPLSQNFPLPTAIILFRRADGRLICIEGGHRVCAAAYAKKVGAPIKFEGQPPVSAAIAQVDDEEIEKMIGFLKEGTLKKKTP